MLSEVDDVAGGITESAERVVKENTDDVVETVMERGSGAVSRGEYLRNKYGALTKEELNNRINFRQAVHDELDRLKASGLTKNEIGPMVAGIYDELASLFLY